MCSHRHIILNKVYHQLQGENVYAANQEMRYSYSASTRDKGCSVRACGQQRSLRTGEARQVFLRDDTEGGTEVWCNYERRS